MTQGVILPATPIPATEQLLADTGALGSPETGAHLAGRSMKPNGLGETRGSEQGRERDTSPLLPGAHGELEKTSQCKVLYMENHGEQLHLRAYLRSTCFKEIYSMCQST